MLTAGGLTLVPFATIGYLGLAATLGAASGACFALVAKVVPAAQVGSVTGVVGAAGGLGGFVPPLVMGALYGSFGNYRIGLLLLAAIALGAAALTWWPCGGWPTTWDNANQPLCPARADGIDHWPLEGGPS